MVMKTPGVYIVEKSAFPNSVVQVATAVPAFIGYTEKAMNGNVSLHETHHQQPCRGHALGSQLLAHAPPAVSPGGDAQGPAPHCVAHPQEDRLTAKTPHVDRLASVASRCPLLQEIELPSRYESISRKTA